MPKRHILIINPICEKAEVIRSALSDLDDCDVTILPSLTQAHGLIINDEVNMIIICIGDQEDWSTIGIEESRLFSERLIHTHRYRLIAIIQSDQSKIMPQLIKSGFSLVIPEPVHAKQLCKQISGLFRLAAMHQELELRWQTAGQFQTFGETEAALPEAQGEVPLNLSTPRILVYNTTGDNPYTASVISRLKSFAFIKTVDNEEDAIKALASNVADICAVIVDSEQTETGLSFIAGTLATTEFNRFPMVAVLAEADSTLVEECFSQGCSDLFLGDMSAADLNVRVRMLTRIEKMREVINKDFDSLQGSRIKDTLTDCYTYGFAMEHLQKLIESSKTDGKPISIAYLRISNLADINLYYDFSSGDHVWRQFASIINRVSRSTDLVARLSGTSILLIFHDASLSKAQEILDRFTSIVGRIVFKLPGLEETVRLNLDQACLNWEGELEAKNFVDRLNTILRRNDAA